MSLKIDANVTTDLTWDYIQRRPALTKLYEKGKRSQWNASTDIDWSPDVNWGSEPEFEMPEGFGFDFEQPPLDRLDEKARHRLAWEFQSWSVSQFMHGEQGALVATARLVETVPDIDSKFYAANQVADEARHVEAYGRYLNEKLGHSYEISQPLASLLTDIMTEPRWDITYLGMQIMVEGLALAAFGMANVIFLDPIIKEITELVMRDEARHVAFGVLSLQGLYDDMPPREMAEREEFIMQAATLIRDRFLLEQMWERMEIPVEAGKEFARTNILMVLFRQMLFSKIVPNLNKLGLLTDRVRAHFEDLGVIHHVNSLDSVTEYDPELLASQE